MASVSVIFSIGVKRNVLRYNADYKGTSEQGHDRRNGAVLVERHVHIYGGDGLYGDVDGVGVGRGSGEGVGSEIRGAQVEKNAGVVRRS